MTPQLARLGHGAVTQEALDAVQWFMSNGWSPAAAIGIVGGLQQESGAKLNPTIWGDNGASYGVAQWNKPGGRYRLFFNWAAQNGLDPHDRYTQYAFVDRELRTTHARAGQKIEDAATRGDWGALATAMGRDYEGASIEAVSARASNAMALANAWQGGLRPGPMMALPGSTQQEYATLPSLAGPQPTGPVMMGMPGGADLSLMPQAQSAEAIFANAPPRPDQNQGQGPTMQALHLGPMGGGVQFQPPAQQDPAGGIGAALSGIMKGLSAGAETPRLDIGDSSPFDADAFAAQNAQKAGQTRDFLLPVAENTSTSPQPLQLSAPPAPEAPLTGAQGFMGPFQQMLRPKTAQLGRGTRIRG